VRDQRAERVADIIVDYSVKVKEGELVTIRGAYVAEPLLLALYQRCIERGAHPMLRATIPQAAPVLYRYAKDNQLEFIWETDRWMVENVDVSLMVIADTNTRQMSRIDPSKQAVASRARKDLLKRDLERAAAGEHRWNLTLYPTEAHAMEAGMSLDEFEDLYYAACLIDADDPVAEWEKVSERHKRLLEWMKDRSEVHIEGEGTDITLDVGGRTWLAADGEANFPDGEIFTGPEESATTGSVTFTYPAEYGGQLVEGIRLEFDKGRVVEASARTNESFLLETLDTDEGARVLGELGIGTNYGIREFTGSTLLDEKIGGTIHLAVGAAYPESGGTNESSVHWDMVCDLRKGGRVTVDGDLLMEDGKLLV
jgi:aminopeptidase